MEQLYNLLEAGKEAHTQGGNVHRALGFDQLSAKNYQRLKTSQDIATQAQESLQIIDIQYFTTQSYLATNFLRTYATYNQQIAEVLALWDASHQNGKYFQHISEGELWQRRNKVYDYQISPPGSSLGP